MSKTHRINQLMALFRTLSPPVTAAQLSAELGVSVRTAYRDIDTLRTMGALIDGCSGFGYTLVESPVLPPLQLSTNEAEAIMLGLKTVQNLSDPALVSAATVALAKLKAALPPSTRQKIEHSILHAVRFDAQPDLRIDPVVLRNATREERAVELAYEDKFGARTLRTVLPLSITYLDRSIVLLARCELRKGFRVFRLDRMSSLRVTKRSFRPNRASLLRDHLKILSEDTKKRRTSGQPLDRAYGVSPVKHGRTLACNRKENSII